jgi:hypothetical protein
MKTIKLSVFGIIINLTGDGGGAISSTDLKTLHNDEEDELYNSAMDGIESMILGHAIAGVDVESPAYLEGIETAVEGCASNC